LNGLPICSAPENQEYSQIASCEGNTFVLCWQDYRNGNADIYAQKINLNGKMLWKTNGEIGCNVAGNQEKPQIIGGENPIIVWTDFRNGTGNSDIFCQKLSASGTSLWNKYGVSVCEAQGNQSNPKVDSDNEGGIVVTWQDLRNASSSIYARRINKDGKAIWSPDGVTVCNENYKAEFPQISLLNNGNYIIVWQDKRQGGLEIFSQGVSSSGTMLWKKNGVDIVFDFGSVTQQKPKITSCGNNEYVIVWEDYRNGYSNIYAQRINNSGKILWQRDGIRICNFECNQLNPEIVFDDEGGAIIVWEDTRNEQSSIYCQRIDAFGNKLWDEKGILICPNDGEKINPKITKDQNSGAIIVWQDARKKEGQYDIYSQRIDNNGSIIWRIDGVDLSTNTGLQTSLKVFSDGDGGAITTWVEYKNNMNTPDIYAQRISSSGNIIWDLPGLSVCRAPEAQRNPDISVGEQIIIVWEDSGGGNYDIYVQKLNKDGSIAWKCDGIPVCTAPFTQHEPKLVLNDDGGATITWEDYRKTNWDIYLQRIDAYGEFVWTKDGIEVCGTSGTQYAPQIVKCKDFSSIIVWEDYRNNKSYNIYVQKLSGSGIPLWDIDGYPVCVTDGGARNPQIIEDGKDGAIIVWTDYRYGSFDIYAQRINENHNL
jgi:hypothetical protein